LRGSLLAFVCIALFASSGAGEARVFPDSQWQTASCAGQGIEEKKLIAALDYLHAHAGGVGTDEMVVVRNGFLIWQGPAAENVHEICSCTKTFTSTALGLLADEGKLGLEDRAVSYLPELDDDYPEYGRIQLHHLASMTSGYDGVMGDGWRFYRTDPNRHLEHVRSYLTPGPPMFPAGTSFKYHDPGVHLLGYILTRLARRPLQDLIEQRVAEPIGMRHFSWSDYGTRDGLLFNNPAGTPGPGQGGIHSNALDLARYGLLYLREGRWKNAQVLDPNFVARATSNQVPAEIQTPYFDLTGRYGFFWWTNGIRADGTRPWPDAPPRTYAAHGAGRNFIFILPEWQMVLVRLSPQPSDDTSGGTVSESVWNEFFTRLRSAVEP
jgi:CubicO group peptidase (beta-lactamase class C family)